MDDMSQRLANTPEQVEIADCNILENNGEVVFKFEFARPMKDGEVGALCNNPHSIISKIIMRKLQEKGWASADGQKLNVSLRYKVDKQDGGKSWKISCTRYDLGNALGLD